MKLIAVLGVFALCNAALCPAVETNLVANGSFEQSQSRAGVPDDWACAGNTAIHQQLVLDTGRDGKRCAKLECT